MINLILTAFVFELAIASEVLLWLEQKKRVAMLGGKLRSSSGEWRLRILRPLLAGIVTFVLLSQVEKATLAKQEAGRVELAQ